MRYIVLLAAFDHQIQRKSTLVDSKSALVDGNDRFFVKAHGLWQWTWFFCDRCG